jgi:DNA-binding NtrC family response regulator
MDDSELVREVAGYMLGLLGYRVDFANDGDSALKVIAEASLGGDPFGYAILDLNIASGKGALEIIGDIIKTDPNIRAILSSGFVCDPSTGDYMNKGFMGIIPKPYQIDELERILKRVGSMEPFRLSF